MDKRLIIFMFAFLLLVSSVSADIQYYHDASDNKSVWFVYNLTTTKTFMVTNQTSYAKNISYVLKTPVGFWPFENVSRDFVSTADGTVTGAAQPASSTCKYGKCYSFNGVTQYITLPNDLYETHASGTILAWIRPTDKGNYYTIFGSGDGAGNSIFCIRLDQTSGTLNYVFRTSAGTGLFWVYATTPIISASWSLVAVRSNGTKISFFVNGTEVANTVGGGVNSGQWLHDIGLGTSTPRIGARTAGGAAVEPFSGLIDEVRIYDKALTNSEIQRIYNSTRFGNSSNIKTVVDAQNSKFTVAGNSSKQNYLILLRNVTQTGKLNITLTAGNYSVYAKDIFTSVNINSFSARFVNGSFSQTRYTNAGSVLINVNPHISKYNITFFNTTLYANRTYYNYNFSYSADLTGQLYTRNSINITCYYENSSRIYQDFFAKFITTGSEVTYTLTNGTDYIDNLTAASYTIQVWNTLFSPKYYYVTILNGTYTALSVYFPSNLSETKEFFFRTSANIPIENANITLTKLIGSSWVAVSQVISDSAGVAVFGLDNYEQYKLLISASGYTTKIVTINTVPSIDSYTVILQSATVVNFTTVFDMMEYVITPAGSVLANTLNQTFNLTTSSTNSLIQWFAVWYNSTLNDNVTASPAGGSALTSLNLTGVLNGSSHKTILVTYYIKVQTKPLMTIQRYYYITSSTTGNLSYGNNSILEGLQDLGANASYDIYAKMLLACVWIVLLTLLFSIVLREDDVDGNKKMNAIPMLVGIIVFSAVSWIPLIFGILMSIILLLNVIPTRQS